MIEKSTEHARPAGALRRPAPTKTVAAAVLLVILGASGATATGAPASGPPKGGKISWSVAPAGGRAADARTEFSYRNVKPGALIQDHAAITNHSLQRVTFTVYATDAVTSTTGALGLLAASRKPTDVGSWAAFPHRQVTIAAGKQAVEPFTVRVPANATPGDHTGGVVASVSEITKNAAGNDVTVDERLAVPIALAVSGPLHPTLAVESLSTRYDGSVNPFGGGGSWVAYTVHNTGNVRLSGRQSVSITGPFGTSATIHPPALPTLLPGSTFRVQAWVPDVMPAGPLTAHVRLLPAPPAGATSLAVASTPVSASASLFAMPWPQLVLLLVLVALVVGGLLLRRRQHRRRAATVHQIAARARADVAAELGVGSGPEQSTGRHSAAEHRGGLASLDAETE